MVQMENLYHPEKVVPVTLVLVVLADRAIHLEVQEDQLVLADLVVLVTLVLVAQVVLADLVVLETLVRVVQVVLADLVVLVILVLVAQVA